MGYQPLVGIFALRLHFETKGLKTNLSEMQSNKILGRLHGGRRRFLSLFRRSSSMFLEPHFLADMARKKSPANRAL
jgi:hypothetical protein